MANLPDDWLLRKDLVSRLGMYRSMLQDVVINDINLEALGRFGYPGMDVQGGLIYLNNQGVQPETFLEVMWGVLAERIRSDPSIKNLFPNYTANDLVHRVK